LGRGEANARFALDLVRHRAEADKAGFTRAQRLVDNVRNAIGADERRRRVRDRERELGTGVERFLHIGSVPDHAPAPDSRRDCRAIVVKAAYGEQLIVPYMLVTNLELRDPQIVGLDLRSIATRLTGPC